MSKTAQENTNKPISPVPTLEQIKAKHKATWEDGDYAAFAKYMEAGAIEILENWQIAPNQRLLDIGCGSGQSAIPAARMGHNVTGIDIAENLIEYANEVANAEGLDATFDVGDAEDLPYENNSFDVVITMIGAMFAPRPEKVASEIARVLRPGGKLYMANWTPNGMPAQMFKCVAGITPPPPGFIPPALWGDEETVTERLSTAFNDLKLTRKNYPQWHYPFTTDGIVDLFRTYFGPVKRAFDKLEAENVDTENFRSQLLEIYNRTSENHPDGTSTVTGGEYLNITATRHADA